MFVDTLSHDFPRMPRATGRLVNHGEAFSKCRDQWDLYQGTVYKLYWLENRGLAEVMDIMKADHGFSATSVHISQFLSVSL